MATSIKLLVLFSLSAVLPKVGHSQTLNDTRPAFGEYYGSNSRQFEISGTLTVDMTTSDYSDTVIREFIVEDRLLAFETYLAALLTDKYPNVFANFNYGNYKSTVRHNTVRAVGVYPSPITNVYHIDYVGLVAGPTDLIDLIGEDFDLQMPSGAMGSDFGFPLYEIRRFDPDTAVVPIELHRVYLDDLPPPSNTYPEYDRLLTDDVLDITVWSGYDYTVDRYDLFTSMRSWLTLFLAGFDMVNANDYGTKDQVVYDAVTETMRIYYPGSITEYSIELFSRLRPDTVFSKMVNYKGRQVTINVRLKHRNLYEGQNLQMKDDFIQAAIESDVFIYNGHAGSYYGWYLGPESDAYLGTDAIENVSLSADYQLIVASGCQTYSTYADHFYNNPTKDTGNLDVITAVNWIQLGHAERSINDILEMFVTDVSSEFQTYSFGEIIHEPNHDIHDPDSYWAVLGANDNPVVSPLANTGDFGKPCSADTDCGVVPANRCIANQCTVQTLNRYVCPANYDFLDSFGVWGAYCVPRNIPPASPGPRTISSFRFFSY